MKKIITVNTAWPKYTVSESSMKQFYQNISFINGLFRQNSQRRRSNTLTQKLTPNDNLRVCLDFVSLISLVPAITKYFKYLNVHAQISVQYP